MSSQNEEFVRAQIDRLFVLLKDGLSDTILQQYRQKYSDANYIAEIRSVLTLDSERYTESDFQSIVGLLPKIEPVDWLRLLTSHWELFQKKIERVGKQQAEYLITLNDRRVNDEPISLAQASIGAQFAEALLQSIDSPKTSEANAICEELRARTAEAETLRMFKPISTLQNATKFGVPPADGVIPSLPNLDETPSNESYEEQSSTEPINPIPVESGLCIQIIGTTGNTRWAVLEAERAIIGRSPSHCQIILEDPQASRVHLQLLKTSENTLKVIDLYSANGTKLEDHWLKPNEPEEWQIGQVAVVGGTMLILRRDNQQSN